VELSIAISSHTSLNNYYVEYFETILKYLDKLNLYNSPNYPNKNC